MTLKSVGDQLPGGKFQDIIFEVEAKPHDLFYMEGNDLVMEVELTLVESLCGWGKTLRHINGSTFYYETVKCTSNGFEDRVPGWGMPSLTDPSVHLDLLLRFRVKLPEELTQEQKSCLMSVF